MKTVKHYYKMLQKLLQVYVILVIETDDLVVGVHQLKRRVGGLGGETNGLGGSSWQAHAGQDCGNQYFFHRHFPENINVKDSF